MIERLVGKKLCTFCGTCFSVCSRQAINFERKQDKYFFSVDQNKCNRCGDCIKACPGIGSDFASLSQGGSSGASQNELIGCYRQLYLGRMAKENITEGVSCGGCATGILSYLLKSKKIDYAVVVKDSPADPFSPIVCLTKKKEDILAARGSKYISIPLNLFLERVLKKKGKYAIVGLPCHLEGIRKAQLMFPKLKERIFLLIGLFCGQTISSEGLIFLLKILGLKEEEVVQIKFRSGKWPGQIAVFTKDGNVRRVDYLKYMSIFNIGLFVRPRCLLCPDFTSELADISLGEAWTTENIKKRKGENIIIVRTRKGEKCLKLVEDEMEKRTISLTDVKKIQYFRLYSKKNCIFLLESLLKTFNFPSPKYIFPKFQLKKENSLRLVFGLSYKLFFMNSYLTFRFAKTCLKFWPLIYLYWKLIWNINKFFSFLFRSIFISTGGIKYNEGRGK